MLSRLFANSSISAISCCSISVASMVFLLDRLIIAGHEFVERRFGEPGFFRLAEGRIGIAE